MNYKASFFLKQRPAVTLPLRDLILQRFHLFYQMLNTCGLLLKYSVPLSCNHYSRASVHMHLKHPPSPPFPKGIHKQNQLKEGSFEAKHWQNFVRKTVWLEIVESSTLSKWVCQSCGWFLISFTVVWKEIGSLVHERLALESNTFCKL